MVKLWLKIAYKVWQNKAVSKIFKEFSQTKEYHLMHKTVECLLTTMPTLAVLSCDADAINLSLGATVTKLMSFSCAHSVDIVWRVVMWSESNFATGGSDHSFKVESSLPETRKFDDNLRYKS